MELIKFSNVEEKIIILRNTKVIIDSDVAVLYGVQTKEINQAIKNNPEKFPNEYIISLTKEDKTELVKNFDHLQNLKFSSQLPKAITEKGLYMLATILKSPQATQTTISIIETFAKIKSLSQTIKEVSNTSNDKKKRTKRGSEVTERRRDGETERRRDGEKDEAIESLNFEFLNQKANEARGR